MIYVAILVILYIVIFSSQTTNDTKKVNEIDQALNEIEDLDLTEATCITGINDAYRFVVDNKNKRIIYTTGYTTSVIPFDKIINVSINEDGTTIASKSSLRTIGGAVIGGAVAGGVGTIVGGLSGKTTMKKRISKIQVIIQIRDLQNPSITIDCLDCTTITISGKPIDTNEDIYTEAIIQAKKIADLIYVIIDMTDKEQNAHATTDNTSTTISNLERLAALKEKGLITEEEFNEQKKILLDSTKA